MNLLPTRCGELIVGSQTATADQYGLARYQRLIPSGNVDPEANQLSRLQTLASQAKLSHLTMLTENWDGFGSAKPSSRAVANASARLPELYRLTTVKGVWREPHISANEDGEVSFEWWSGQRKVTMYFGDSSVELIRVWGLNIDTEMDQRHLPTLDAFPAVWAWLYGN